MESVRKNGPDPPTNEFAFGPATSKRNLIRGVLPLADLSINETDYYGVASIIAPFCNLMRYMD